MINTEQTARIACSFIASFYKGFVENMPSLVSFYGDMSSTSFARVGDAVATTSQGRAEVQQYLERLNNELGPRKVDVRTADFVPTADGSVAITVTGQLFTKRLRQAFTQTFVLSATKFKENTMFISADSLRFVSSVQERVPANAIVVGPGEELPAVQVNNRPEVAAERKERPPRKERKPREEKEAAAVEVAKVAPLMDERPARKERPAPKEREPQEAPSKPLQVAAPAAEAVAAERPERRPKPTKQEAPAKQTATAPSWAGLVTRQAVEVPKPKTSAEKKDNANSTFVDKKKRDVPPVKEEVVAAPSPKETSLPARERVLTTKVRLIKVPKVIRLSEVRTAASKFGNVKDAFWRGEDDEDAVVVFSSPEEARAFQTDRAFTLNEFKIRRFFFFDQ